MAIKYAKIRTVEKAKPSIKITDRKAIIKSTKIDKPVTKKVKVN